MQPSRLPAGAKFEGRIRGQGDLIVAGEVDGPIEIEGSLVVEQGGVVRGEVRARSVTVWGRVEGHVSATEVLRLEAGARLVGDARADRVSAATGALLRGRVRTNTERAHQERMRRTTGGTLLAPFSSAGFISAPSTAGFISAPSPAGHLTSSQPDVARPAAEDPPVHAAESRPRPASNRPQPLLSSSSIPKRDPSSIEVAASSDAISLDNPPAPIVPTIGRQKVRPRGAGDERP